MRKDDERFRLDPKSAGDLLNSMFQAETVEDFDKVTRDFIESQGENYAGNESAWFALNAEAELIATQYSITKDWGIWNYTHLREKFENLQRQVSFMKPEDPLAPTIVAFHNDKLAPILAQNDFLLEEFQNPKKWTLETPTKEE